MTEGKGAGLKPAMIERALELRAALDAVNGDVERWCDGLGYELRFAKLRYGAYSVLFKTLFGTEIRVKHGLSWKEQVGSIAHEICHDLFHASCVSYRILGKVRIDIDEGQAEMFAAIIVFPTLTEYQTTDEFMRTCGVTASLAEMRVMFWEKYGW